MLILSQNETMTRLLLALFALICCTSQLAAQVPTTARAIGRTGLQNARMNCSAQSAGTINGVVPLNAATTDFDLDTVFLCLNDTVLINHNGDGDISGDPNPATPGGIGYAIYSCPPTVAATDLFSLVNTDPCLIANPADTSFTGYLPPDLSDRSGDAPFFNTGILQSQFNAGNPVLLWFAPITYDDTDGATLMYEDSGSCLDVGVDQAFAVVFLNEIRSDNLLTDGCSGSFRLEGGLPEFDNSAIYNIDISLVSDPSVQGMVTNTGGVMNNETVTFFVPQAGTYEVTVTDAKSCPTTFTVDMPGCTSVTFDAPLRNATNGQNICLPITTTDFVDLISFQYTLSWNTAVLQFDQVTNFNANLPGFNAAGIGLPGAGSVPNNSITANWFTSGNGVTLANDEVLFEICFNVIGTAGQSSAIDFSGSSAPVEVFNSATDPVGFILNDGQVNISTAPFFLSLDQEPERCVGENNGRLIVTVDQGTAPYTVLVDTDPVSNPSPFRNATITTNQGTFVFDNMPPGDYTVTVTDNSAVPVTATDNIEVQSPPSLGINLVSVLPSCFGFSDGSVEAEVFLDGVPQTNPGSDFSFTWNTTTANTRILFNQPSGFYSVTVTGPTGCTATASTTLSQPPAIRTVGASSFPTDASCSGFADGAINLAVTGGNTVTTGAYTFTWDNGIPSSTGTSTNVPDLLPGNTYSVTITDDSNCTSDTSFFVGAAKTLIISSGITDVQCFGETNGSILATGSTLPASDEDLPYTFAWSSFNTPPVETDRETTITDLAAGNYFLTMTDATGCEVIDSFEVIQPDTLVVTLETVNETCAVGNDGSITATVTGGTFPYNYVWSHDSLLMDSIALGLSSDTLPYILTVTDLNGCEAVVDTFIFAPAGPQIVSLQNSTVSCADDTDGTLSVTAVPTNAPIVSYQWSNGSTQTSLTNLSPGIYGLTITAEDACVTIDSGIVAAPAPIAIDSIGLRLPSCPGFNDGQISLVVVGGTPPYSYTWSTNPGQPSTLNPLPGLEAGTYSVTITDANNCTPVIQTINLPDPPTIQVSFSNVIDASCPDDVTCDGQATATGSFSDGTAGVFNFIWGSGQQDDGVLSSTATGLCRGPQSLVITDGSCSQSFEVVIGSPDSIVVDGEITRVSCNAGEDGAITITPTGGTAPYNILWEQTGETTETITDLVAGEYTAIITDDQGCLNQQFFEVTEPDALILEVDPVRTTLSVSCAGDMDGVLAVTADTSFTNPLPINPYSWGGGIADETSDIAEGLAPGEYFVTITDVKGCQDSLSYTIAEPLPITFSLLPIDEPACFGESTIVLIDTAFGGAGMSLDDYVFILNNDGFEIPVRQAGSIFAGENVVTVADPNGCTASDSFFINQPPEIVVTLPESVTIELGDSTSQLTPVVDPPGDVYTYQWTPGTFLSSDTVRAPFIDPRADQLYNLLVLNQSGCSAQASIFVEVDANRNVFIPNAFSPDGDGRNDEFRIFTCRGVTAVNSVVIFDRWGNVVFEQSEMMPNCLDGIRLWDGRQTDQPVNAGVYVYMAEVEFLDGVTLVYRGDIAVVR